MVNGDFTRQLLMNNDNKTVKEKKEPVEKFKIKKTRSLDPKL